MRWLLALLLVALPAAAQDRYYPFEIDQDRLEGAPDFSFLNQPIRAEDRVVVRGSHFVTLGNAQRMRFFGTNLVFSGVFPEEQDAARVAKRLRRLGINLVRLHHMETSPDEDPARARSIITTGPYPTLNSVSVERLKRLIAEFQKEGIYINLNLHVGYEFRPAVDKVPVLPGQAALPTHSKPLHIFYPRMVDLQVDFTHKVINALGLKQHPVLAMVEINNETSLIYAWQRGQLDRYLDGEYRKELQKQWNDYLRKKYPTTAAMRGAWRAPDTAQAWGEGASLEGANIPLVPEKTLEPKQMVDDYLLFLVDRDREYLRRMKEAVRASAGPDVPIAGTQMDFGGPLTFDSHQDLDYMDSHFYIDHYNFPNQRWDSRDWRIRDSSITGMGLSTYIQVAAVRKAGEPYTVSEFNQNWPNRNAAELMPTMAAYAVFQEWDGLMHFAYAHNTAWDSRTPSGFDLNSDWTKYAAFGQSAWLYRSGAIQPGQKVLKVPFPLEMRLEAGRTGRIRDVSAFIEEKLGIPQSQMFQHRVELDPKGAVPAPAAMKRKPEGVYRTDTGQMSYDPTRKLFLVHADRAAGIFGTAGTAKATAGAIDLELAPQSRGFASLLLTPLDNQPLARSGRMLLTLPGYTLRTYSGSNPPRPQRFIAYPGTADWWTLEPDPEAMEKPSGNRAGGNTPIWMERVEGTLTLRTNARALTVYPLDGMGRRGPALPAKDVVKTGNAYRIHLQAEGQTFAPWYELVAGN